MTMKQMVIKSFDIYQNTLRVVANLLEKITLCRNKRRDISLETRLVLVRLDL